jgi:hypothetical protein
MHEEELLGQRYIPGQPQKTFGGDVLLLLELVDDEVLKGF